MVKLQEVAASLARHYGTGKVVGGLTLEEAALDALHIAQMSERGNRPTIVCLCGSTRFSAAFRDTNLRETLDGKIVLSIGCDMRSDHDIFGNLPADELERIKRDLDDLHLRKIDLADEVLILNVGGYIGQSTSRELAYARAHGKRVRFLEPHP